MARTDSTAWTHANESNRAMSTEESDIMRSALLAAIYELNQ